MSDQQQYDIDRYCVKSVKSEKMLWDWSIYDIIGREYQITVLKGTIPYFDDDDNNYKCLDRYNYKCTKNEAVLFVGEEGNGKKTLNNAYASFIQSSYKDEDIETLFYKIPIDLYVHKDKHKMIGNIKSLFEKVTKKIHDISEKKDEVSILYISFEDVTKLLKRKSIALEFAKHIEKILNIELENVAVFIVAETILPMYKVPLIISEVFIPLFLDNPTLSERVKYFNFFSERNTSVVLGLDFEEIAEMTKGFTFAMLRQTIELLYLWTQGDLLFSPEIKKYYSGEAEVKYIISKEIIESTIEIISNQNYVSTTIPPQQYMMNVPLQYNISEEKTSEKTGNINSEKTLLDMSEEERNIEFEGEAYTHTLYDVQEKKRSLLPALVTEQVMDWNKINN